MSRLNLKEACLLAVSGELSPAARRELLLEIQNNPEIRQEYEKLGQGFSLLEALPIPEPSAEERMRIPTAIKTALREELRLHERRLAPPGRRRMGVWAGVAALAACVVLWMSAAPLRVNPAPQPTQAARIDALIDRVAYLSYRPTAYEEALSELEASIRQLQTGSPTLANLHDSNMIDLLDALAAVPTGFDKYSREDYAGTPGSF